MSVGINGWLLLAQVIDAPGPRWSPEWSDALDATILMLRKESRTWHDPHRPFSKHWHSAPGLTPEEQHRRATVAAHLSGSPVPNRPVPPVPNGTTSTTTTRTNGARREPTPVLMPNGRWLMRFAHAGQQYRAWFDTEQAARAWAAQVKSA